MFSEAGTRYAITADSDEAAYTKPLYLDLHCMPCSL